MNRRKILALHRWLGLLSALFLVVVSITGLALNHTERLGLDKIRIQNAWLLKCYGMQNASNIQAYRIHKTDTLAHLDGQLYYNATNLGMSSSPLALFQAEQLTAIVAAKSLTLITPTGELIEQIKANRLPYASLLAAGKNQVGKVVLAADNGLWLPDANWLQFTAYTGAYIVNPLAKLQLTANQTDKLLALHQGKGPSLYRTLLDLHSGRLFGWGGRTLMDLTAIAVLFLITSGLTSWFRKSKPRNK
jgi:hypothetical protein